MLLWDLTQVCQIIHNNNKEFAKHRNKITEMIVSLLLLEPFTQMNEN
jgi:hypothetical protein